MSRERRRRPVYSPAQVTAPKPRDAREYREKTCAVRGVGLPLLFQSVTGVYVPGWLRVPLNHPISPNSSLLWTYTLWFSFYSIPPFLLSLPSLIWHFITLSLIRWELVSHRTHSLNSRSCPLILLDPVQALTSLFFTSISISTLVFLQRQRHNFPKKKILSSFFPFLLLLTQIGLSGLAIPQSYMENVSKRNQKHSERGSFFILWTPYVHFCNLCSRRKVFGLLLSSLCCFA